MTIENVVQVDEKIGKILDLEFENYAAKNNIDCPILTCKVQ